MAIFLTMASDSETVVGDESPGRDVSVFWSFVWWAPNKLATSVDQLSWWLRGGGLPATMDTLNTLLLGWLFSALLILVLVKFLYDKFLRGGDDEDFIEASEVLNEQGSRTCSGNNAATSESIKREERREPTIVPHPTAVASGSAGVVTGQDADAVQWMTTLLKWLYRAPPTAVAAPYLTLLNDMTAQTALETGVLVEVETLLPSTPAPTLRNIVLDCAPDDSMHLTCDCEGAAYLRVQTTRTRREVTTESEYAVVVRPLLGRLSAAIDSHRGKAALKFEGWPQVEIELEGIRNNEVGLGEKELQEVTKEVVAGAIRSMVLELDLKKEKDFPCFKRPRELPDKVLPLGYDSMVREHQTHPPLLKPKSNAKPRHIPSVSLADSRPAPQGLGHAAAQPPISNSALTSNVRSVLTSSEEQLIARNISEYGGEFVSLQHGDQIKGNKAGINELVSGDRITWERGYVPGEFMEQVKAVTMAKVEEKNLAEPKKDQQFVLVASNRQKPLDEPKAIPAFDYIPYDSEYEEDEDAEDYLEKSNAKDQVKGAVKKPHVSLLKTDEVFVPTESDVKAMVAKVADLFSLKSPPVGTSSKCMEVLPQSTAPLGAMGLPHLPKSHFTPSLVPPPSPPGLSCLTGKRLLVKVVKATSIGCDKSPVDSYVVLEMDEPNQKFTTAAVKANNSPFWDEQFLFELSDATLELLFELYDETDSSFLGLGIVGIEELVATPSQRQIIPLQARPYEQDRVSGTLTVEFLFLEGGALPELTVRCSSAQQQRAAAGGRASTITATALQTSQPAGVVVNGSAGTAATLTDRRDVAPAAAERGNGDEGGVRGDTSTVIIHAANKVSRMPSGEYTELEESYSQPEEEVEEGNDSDDNYVVNTLQYPFQTTTPSEVLPNITTYTTKSTPTTTATTAVSTVVPAKTTTSNNQTALSDTTDEDDGRGRSRGKQKKDSFFGNLKKRFSRSKVRSQSVEPTSPPKSNFVDTDWEVYPPERGVESYSTSKGALQSPRQPVPGNDVPRTATVGRSVSMERASRLRPTDINVEKRKSAPVPASPVLAGAVVASSDRHTTSLLSVPKAAEVSGGESASTRSSLSDTSGLSGSSTRTYFNEASMLIVETTENGVLRHYLVPVSLQQRNRWTKRGTKLHVYSGHTFEAKHISSSVLCSVCEKAFPRRPGKQGYECRDCGQRTHKPCHVRTDVQCPNSKVNSMDLVYIRDPREERKAQRNQRF